MKEVMTQKLSGQMLHKLAHSSETAENVCVALGTRQRIRDFSNINSLKYELRKEGFKIVESDYMKMWKDWQEAGLGVILLGRGKKQNKFIHYYDMRKIAEAAMAGKDLEVELRNKDQKSVIDEANRMQIDRIAKSIGTATREAKKSIDKTVVIEKKEKPAPTTSPAATPSVSHVFISIRPNFFVDLKLPQDLTSTELSMIQEALSRVVPATASKVA